MPPPLLGKHSPLNYARAQQDISLARLLTVGCQFRPQVSTKIGGAIA
jgi:hypothetical protein